MKKWDEGRKEQHHTQKVWLLKLEEGVKIEMMIETTKVEVGVSQGLNIKILFVIFLVRQVT